jgi:uncharacterized protein DUF6925
MSTRRSPQLSVLVCRGCCCGTSAKHPDVDHDEQLAAMRAAAARAGNVKLWVVDCLGPCERSNVFVVRRGPRRWWFGEVLSDTTVDALCAWAEAGAAGDVPSSLRRHEFSGPGDVSAPVERALSQHGHLLDFVNQSMARGDTWTVGVHGGVAEFDAAGASVDVDVATSTVTARRSTGAIRLELAGVEAFRVARVDRVDETYAMVLATRTVPGAQPAAVIERVGIDRRSIDGKGRLDELFDLGLGRAAARFMIRTSDPIVVGLLRELDGTEWSDIADDTWMALVEASPTRVVESMVGRIEVDTPIPIAEEVSPPGTHTHLLPPLLVLDRDLPPGIELPPGYVPGAICYPRAVG